MSATVECCDHGMQAQAYVCTHITHALRDNKPNGFIWSRDDDNHINAYCNQCDDMLENEFGGDWENVPKDRYELSILCEPCAIRAARLSGVEVSP